MNFEDYESLPVNGIGTNMTAGAIAGIMEHCVMYPMDSIKASILTKSCHFVPVV